MSHPISIIYISFLGLLNQIDIHNLYVAISIFLVIVSVPSDPAPGANVFTTTLPSAYTAGGVPASSGSVRISSPIPIQTAAWWHGQGVGIGMGGSWPSMAILVPLQGFDHCSNVARKGNLINLGRHKILNRHSCIKSQTEPKSPWMARNPSARCPRPTPATRCQAETLKHS